MNSMQNFLDFAIESVDKLSITEEQTKQISSIQTEAKIAIEVKKQEIDSKTHKELSRMSEDREFKQGKQFLLDKVAALITTFSTDIKL